MSPVGAQPTIDIADAWAFENTGALVFTATLSVATPQNVSVSYATILTYDPATTTASVAQPGTDYTTASSTLTFTAGQTSRTLTVPVSGDTTTEDDEISTATPSNQTNASLGDAMEIGTIREDDILVQFRTNRSQFTENTLTPPAIFVERTGSIRSGVTVSVVWTATYHGCASCADVNIPASGTFTFTSTGNAIQSYFISVSDDQEIETGDEKITITLSDPVNARLGSLAATGVAGLDDEDGFAIAPANVWVSEGAGAARFTVYLRITQPLQAQV